MYVVACVFLVWLGLHIPPLLNRSGVEVAGGVARRESGEGGSGSRVLAATSATGSMTDAIAGAGGRDTSRDGVGPRLAYGIMVYQRKGYTPDMTLRQFTRMFEALYDPENT